MQNDHDDVERAEGVSDEGNDGNVEAAGSDDQEKKEEAASSYEASSEGGDDGAADEADAESEAEQA